MEYRRGWLGKRDMFRVEIAPPVTRNLSRAFPAARDHSVAGANVGFFLWHQFGLDWFTIGSSRFADLILSPTTAGMTTIAALGAFFGFLYELSEHIAGVIFRI